MTVKQLLSDSTSFEVKIFQVPIKEIDRGVLLVRRYQGGISIALNSNQNYLDFKVEYSYYDNGYLVIIYKANKNQEREIINAYRSKAY